MERHRSVLTRLERLRTLLAKGTWNETMSPLGLPKVKHLKVTVKKEKAAAPAAEGAPELALTPGRAVVILDDDVSREQYSGDFVQILGVQPVSNSLQSGKIFSRTRTVIELFKNRHSLLFGQFLT